MFRRNIAVTGFTLGFVNATTGAAVTTGTPTGFVTLDGGVQAAIAGAFVHEGNGQWSVNLTAGEMNGVIVGLVFVLATAINVHFTIKTVLVDADNATTFGLTNLDAAVASRMATYTQPTGFLAATFPGSVASPTNITAATGIVLSGVTHTGAVIPTVSAVTGLAVANLDATISSRMATYAQPAGFLAAAFPTGTVANTTNITAGVITTATTLTNLPAIPANWLTAAGIAAAALDGKGNWNIGKTGYSLTQSFPANFAATVISAGGTVAGDVIAVAADAGSATKLRRVLLGNATATAGAASTTTSIVTSTMNPAASVIDQFKGRICTFSDITTTAALRGQSTDITASTALGVLTITALTTAPVSGDEFTIS